MSATLYLSYLDILPPDLAAALAEDLKPAGITVESEARPTAPQASIEWLLPTAVVLFVTQKYLGTLIQEAAKEHYPTIKNALKRLVQRTTGENRIIRLQTIATAGKVSSSAPAVFSVYVELRSGARVKFSFEHNLPDEQVTVAVDDLLQVILCYQRGDHSSILAQAQDVVVSSGWRPIVLFFDPQGHSWVLRGAVEPE